MPLRLPIPELGRLIADLAALVAIDTENPPGRESEAADWVRGRMAAIGCEARVAPIGTARANAIGVYENGPGPIFAFNTHLDVVPAGGGWTSDPFRLRRDQGRLYARGACDAKGPLISMLAAIDQLIHASDAWSGTLVGVFVADEEVGSVGARHYVAEAPRVDFCVVGEPTSCTVVTAHKGSLRPVVQIQGKAAHSGTPDLGVNAVMRSAALFDAVATEHRRIATHQHPLVGGPSLTITRIHGGHADNVVPELCEVLLDRRMIPGEEEEDVKEELLALVERTAKASNTAMRVTGYRPTTGGATETAADHPVVQAAQAACRHHHGRGTAIDGFQGGCDLVHFRRLGAQGVVLGPGDLAVAHKPDEYVPEGELALAAQIYRDIALSVLGH